MVDLIDSIKSNPIAYYVGLLIGIALLSLIISLIIKNERKKKEKSKEKLEEKARIEKHVDLEAMIAKMQEQEQEKVKDIDPVANFEQEQEEKAIISYQELVSAVSNDNREPINVINVSSNGDMLSTTTVERDTKVSDDRPIFIDEVKLPKSDMEYDPQEEVIVESKPKAVTYEKPNFEPLTSTKSMNDNSKKLITEIAEVIQKDEIKREENNKFKSSEFISPIYGRQNNNISYPKISSFKDEINDNEDSIINISDEVDPNTEFLNTLRQYRN